MFDNLLSVTSKQEVFPAGVAVCRDNKEVSGQIGCRSNDSITRVKRAYLQRLDFVVLQLRPRQELRQFFLCFLFPTLNLLDGYSFQEVVSRGCFRNHVQQHKLSSQPSR